MISSPTPAELGYRMPAEWEPHQATWLGWPRKEGISYPDHFEGIPEVWAKMTALLSEGEEVHINYFSHDHEKEIRKALEHEGVKIDRSVFLHHFPTYEPWARDHGPIFIRKENELAIVDWKYNAWGGKYPPYDLDDVIPQKVADFLKLPFFTPEMILEGGSIDVNGEGTLLTTEACLLHPNRNPGLSQKKIEEMIMAYLGIKKILWLGEGIVEDDTDGHIDDITRFVAPQIVVTAMEEDPEDENYSILLENRRRLEKMTTAKGEPLLIIDLPMPGVVERHGRRVPASYANFYIANKVVLLPAYGHANDEKAQQILQKLFPQRRVIGVNCLEMIWGLGAFHCATQQQPAINIL